MQRIYADEMEKKRMESEKKNKELYKLLDVKIIFYSFSRKINKLL